MKTKLITRVSNFAIVAVLLLATLGFSSTTVTVDVAQQNNGDVQSPAAMTVAAPKAWTKAQMLAAIPLDVIETQGGDLSTSASAGPTGDPGTFAGKQPKNAAAKGRTNLAGGTQSLLDEETLSGTDLTSFSYPAPFTRQFIDNIANSSVYPFSAIGKLFFTQHGLNYVCSASVIGVGGIATAGHCVHSGNNRGSGWSTNVVFVPAYINGTAPYGQWPVWSLITKSTWYAYGNPGGLRRDVGAGRVDRLSGQRLGDVVGFLGLKWNQSQIQNWWEVGYPAASPFNGMLMTACQSSFAYNSTFGIEGPLTVGVGCDMTGGSSGGPWVLKLGTGNFVNGVNSFRRTGYGKEMFSPYMDTINKSPWTTVRAYLPP